MHAVLDTPECSRMLRTLQIIVGAMIVGVVAFSIIVLCLPPRAPTSSPFQGLLLAIGVVFTLVEQVIGGLVTRAILSGARRGIAAGRQKPTEGQRAFSPVSLFLPGAGLGRTRKQPFDEVFLERNGDAGRLCAEFHRLTIINAALLEGPAFFMLIAQQMEPHWGNLVVVGMLLGGLLLRIPTRAGLERWLGEQLRVVEDLRAARPLAAD